MYRAWVTLLAAAFGTTVLCADGGLSCDSAGAQRLHIEDPPYDNHFYSDCHSSSHVLARNPSSASGSQETLAARFLVAWPAGNSGASLYFAAQDGTPGGLSIKLENSSAAGVLDPIYVESAGSENPQVGVSGRLSFNASAALATSILGSIRSIRDADGNWSNLAPLVRDGIKYDLISGGGASVHRLWLDNVTTTYVDFVPVDGGSNVTLEGGRLNFASGTYQFNASFNFPQLQQLAPSEVLSPDHQGLISQSPDQTSSLSFLSYTNKLLAGAWHYLTYFGRDTMLTLLLMQSVMSLGENGAVEAAIGSVIERISRADGSTCHEETLGDYATYQNLQNGVVSTAPLCDYKMIDTDYYLPVALKTYLVDTDVGRTRADGFLATKATFLADNSGHSYSELALLTLERVMTQAAPFAAPGGQVKENLIHLKDNVPVGEWRDSNAGIGGGRIPYDVNAALVPAALRAIASLSRAGLFPEHPDWAETADKYAKVWEDETLRFFEVTVKPEEAVQLVQTYVKESDFPGPDNTGNITSDVVFYAISLDGWSNQTVVRTMHSDDCFRLFLLNTTNQAQLTTFVSQAADHILQPFPVGLATDAGLLIANPAFGGDPFYAETFTRTAYHGTVVWSWQMAMMAAGLEKQLSRCNACHKPAFCKDKAVFSKVKAAYNRLWDIIEENTAQLGQEAWGWTYDNGFKATSFGLLGAEEGDIRQLWSLTFLAVTRQKF